MLVVGRVEKRFVCVCVRHAGAQRNGVDRNPLTMTLPVSTSML